MSNKTDLQENNEVLASIAEQLANDTENHLKDKNNPHGVTAQQAGALPLTGGTLSGGLLQLNGGTAQLLADSGGLNIFSINGSQNRYLTIGNSSYKSAVKDALSLTDNTSSGSKSYNIYGEHNKPRGTYTGNGSATARTISTGGLGCAVAIWGGIYSGIIGANGGFIIHGQTGAITAIKNSEAYFVEGALIITTTVDKCNANGVIYSYQVL